LAKRLSTIWQNKPLPNNRIEKIVLASGNRKKIAELQLLLQPLSISVIAQSEFNISDADETGLSFVENALIKARHAAKISGLPAIADDSGLEVDALNGQPGIYSARFARNEKTGTGSDDDNNRLLLEKLKTIPEQKRTARFQCVLVFMKHAADPTPIICQGTWQGRILSAPQGSNGFGYDPVFFVPSHHCSAAQLNAEEKSRISHRGRAMQELLTRLRLLCCENDG
jgi:XTP/dITP diphosphohydrolase